MAYDQTQPPILVCHANRDADFAYTVTAHLRDRGFDVWIERLELDPEVILPPLPEQCGAVIPIISQPLTDNWAHFETHISQIDTQVIPFLLGDVETSSFEEYERTIDFAHWQSELFFESRLEKAVIYLRNHITPDEADIPNEETRYINHTVANIRRYRGFLERISPRSDALPSDKRAIYAQSMWGLTGEFTIHAEETHTTYQFHELLETYPRFVLTGESGSGKTITLYRAVLDLLRAYQGSQDTNPLPVRIDLGHWAEDTRFEDFLRSQIVLGNDPVSLAKEGKIILLLDALDEMGWPCDIKINALRDWLHHHTPHQVVISCDATTYSEKLDLDLPVVHLEPIDPARIRQYIFNHLERDTADELLRQLFTDNRLEIDLAQNALLLAIIVSYVQNQPDAPLPGQESDLLQWFVRHSWQADEVLFEVAQSALARLAFDMIEDNMPSLVDYNYARVRVADDSFILQALDSNLLRMQDGKVAFLHRKVRDFFAAQHLLSEGVYTRLSYPQVDTQGIRHSQRWDDIILAATRLSQDASLMIEQITEVDPYLALECMIYGAQIDERAQKLLIERFLNLTFAFEADTSDVLIQKLLQSFDEQALLLLIENWQLQRTDEGTTMILRKLGQDAVRLLADILKREKWQRRSGAAWALGELREPAAVPSLIEALRDENESVRNEASHALLRIGKPAIPRIVSLLKDEEANMRAVAVKLLGRFKDPSTVPHLIECLGDNEWPFHEEVSISELAAISLRRVGTQDALTAAEKWGKQHKENVEQPDVLAQLAPNDFASEQLLAELEHPNWEVRRNAIIRLGESENNLALPYIIKAVSDSDSSVQLAAIKALEEFSGSDAVHALVSALRTADTAICDAAALALSTKGEEALPGLIEAMTDPSADVRGVAAEALGKIGDEVAIPFLVDALTDTGELRLENSKVNDIAVKALERIGSEKALFALSQWRKERGIDYGVPVVEAPDNIPLLLLDDMSNTDEREVLLRFLDTVHNQNWHDKQQAVQELRAYVHGIQGSDETVSELSNALGSEEPLVRWTAADALGQIGDPSAGQALINALNDPSWTVRVEAVRSLSETEETIAVPGLIQALEDSNAVVRETAAATLGQFEDTRAVPYLIALLSDHDNFVRQAAVNALGEIGDPSASADVIAMLKDQDYAVIWSSVETLGKLKAKEAVSVLQPLLTDTTRPNWEQRRMCDAVAETLQLIGTSQARDALKHRGQA